MEFRRLLLFLLAYHSHSFTILGKYSEKRERSIVFFKAFYYFRIFTSYKGRTGNVRCRFSRFVCLSKQAYLKICLDYIVGASQIISLCFTCHQLGHTNSQMQYTIFANEGCVLQSIVIIMPLKLNAEGKTYYPDKNLFFGILLKKTITTA